MFLSGNPNKKLVPERDARARQAPILPTETYFVKATNKTHIKKQIIAVNGANAKNTPNAVSTPFPPLKPAKQVKLWPTIASIPATNGNQNKSGPPLAMEALFIQSAMDGAKKPFERSISTTGRAGFHPSTLKTFVKPAFLEPCSRMSIFFTIFAIHTAEGIDPNKYAIGRLSKLLKFFILSKG